MNLLIAGASGFIGRQLVAALGSNFHITVLGRDQKNLKTIFPQVHAVVSWDNLASLDAKNYDAVINLSGQSIGASWTEELKKEIIRSRVETTTKLVNWLIDHQSFNTHFYGASAVGIYGAQAEDEHTILDEDTAIDFYRPKDFMSEIGIRWEQALDGAKQVGIPVTITRFGVVLKKGEGMLQKLYPAYYMGMGSVIGNGEQIISWIHYRDVVGALRFLLERPDITGVINITAPNPVTQREFAKTMAKVMKRPLFLKMPGAMVRLLFGEMGEALLLSGQKVVPKRLVKADYQFQLPKLEDALVMELK